MRQLFLFLLTIFSLTAHSQVQVSQEPRHHKVLDNEWVRVLDVHIPPHDTTMMHKHATPSIFIVLSNTKTGSEVLVEPGKATFADGNIWFEGFYEKPRIHRVWNEDTVEFHVMDIELPHTPVPIPGLAATLPFAKQLFDTKPVRAFRMSLPPGQHPSLPQSQAPVLVISLSGPGAKGMVNSQPVSQKGDYFFIPAGASLALKNTGATDLQFALLFLK